VWSPPVQIADVRAACPRQGPFSGAGLVALLEKAPLRRAAGTGPNSGRGPRRLGFGRRQWITEGCLRAGVPVVIVPVISGGSGGVFRTLVFVASHRGPRYVAILRGVEPGHLRVDVEDGFIVERSPQDPESNCCWKHDYVRRSFMVQGRLVVLDVRILFVREEPSRRG